MNPIEYTRMYQSEDSHWWYVGLHELVLERVERESRRLNRPLRILDAGCGTGRLCELMSAYGQVEGIDASENAIRYCVKRGVNAKLADLNELAPEDGAYDVITSIDVLYHAGIRDDVAVLKNLHSALRPGGILILNLVAFEFLRSSHDAAVHTRERYTLPILRHRLAASGFTEIFASYRVSIIFPLIAIYRLLQRFIYLRHSCCGQEVDSDLFIPPSSINSMLLSLIRAENSVMSILRFPLGSSIFAVASRTICIS